MRLWLLAIAFSWTALVLAIKESEGIWRWIFILTLVLSIISLEGIQ
jgi:hypothetical protein